MSLMSKVSGLEQRALQFKETASKIASPPTDHTTRRGTGHLLDRTISVGAGENRGRAQSAQESSKGILSSLSRGLNSVLNSVTGMLKSLGAYLFESSKPDALQRPKEQMSRILKNAQDNVQTLWNGSEPSDPFEKVGNWLNQHVGRPLERMMEPEPSWINKKLQGAEDFLNDRFSR